MDRVLDPILKDIMPKNGNGNGTPEIIAPLMQDIKKMDQDLSSPEVKKVLSSLQRSDGWKNALSGLGTNVDKRTYTRYSASSTSFLDTQTLCSMYANDGLIQRIVGAFPDDMTRQWVSVNEKKENGKEGPVSREMRRLNAPLVFNKALRWARLLGGSLLFISAEDGNAPDRPLELDRVKRIGALRVFDLGEIQTAQSEFETDPMKEDFGKISKYKIMFRRGTEQKLWTVHASRCIAFHGVEVPPSTIEAANILEGRYWGISVVQSVWEYLRDFTGAMGSVSQILYEFMIGKYKLSDLDEILAQGNEKQLHTRIQAIEMTKSILKAVLLGTDEDYTRDAASVAGIPDTLDRFMMLLCAVTEYPVTRLFGRAAAGLNATGENDLRNYYDACKAKQTNELTPGVDRLIEVISAPLGISDIPTYEWNPLIQLSEKEMRDNDRVQAETYRTQADADQRYMQEGVLDPEDVYKMRFEDTLGTRDFFEAPEEDDGPDVTGAEEVPPELGDEEEQE